MLLKRTAATSQRYYDGEVKLPPPARLRYAPPPFLDPSCEVRPLQHRENL